MLKTTAVVVTASGQETVRIGPFIAPTNAVRYAERLHELLEGSLRNVTITTEPADPALPHLPPRVPTDPWLLAQDITDERTTYGDEDPPIPRLHARLIAQLGYDAADATWQRALAWIDDPAADGESPLDQLAEAAENWRHDRDQATDALRGIAVELWRAGMRTKNDLQTITGLSRTTIYEALRNAGIDPTGFHTAAATDAARKIRATASHVDQATHTLADTFRAAGITTDEKPSSD